MATLFFVATGEPTPTKISGGTCYILKMEENLLMIDCGTGAVTKMVQMDLFPTQVNDLLFTHHHFDHNVDYPALLLIRWDQSLSSATPLKVWGPPPTEWITDRLIGPEGAFRDDMKARAEHPASLRIYKMRGGVIPRPSNNCIAQNLSAGERFETARWRITTAKARHVEPWLISLSYRIEWDTGSLVIAGDTGPCQEVTDLARGADTVIAHCKNLQAKVPSDLAAAIYGTREAARMAREAGVKRLVLSHQNIALHKAEARNEGIAEARSEFSGEIIFAQEGTSMAL